MNHKVSKIRKHKMSSGSKWAIGIGIFIIVAIIVSFIILVATDEDVDVDCEGEWGECSEACEGGTQEYNITKEAKGNGAPCTLPDVTSRPCNMEKCGDCNGAWSKCVGECGIDHGVQTYERKWEKTGEGKECEEKDGAERWCHTDGCGVTPTPSSPP